MEFSTEGGGGSATANFPLLVVVVIVVVVNVVFIAVHIVFQSINVLLKLLKATVVVTTPIQPQLNLNISCSWVIHKNDFGYHPTPTQPYPPAMSDKHLSTNNDVIVVIVVNPN